MRHAWMVGLGALILSLGAVATDVLAGKPTQPPPPGPTKYLYYHTTNSPYVQRMNAWDGSGKTTMPVDGSDVDGMQGRSALSFEKYNGAFVYAWLEPNGLQNYDRTWPVSDRPFGLPFTNYGTQPKGTGLDLVVQRMDSGTPVTLLHDASYLLSGVAFVPGEPGKIAINACKWVTDGNGATTLRQGLFLADLALDAAGDITGLAAAPTMVFEAVAPRISPSPPPPEGTLMIEVTLRPSAAWLDAQKVIAMVLSGSFGSEWQLRVLDLATPAASYDLVPPSSGNQVLNPSRTRVSFIGTIGGVKGIWETDLAGTSPTLWAANEGGGTNTGRSVGPFCYFDDNTLIFQNYAWKAGKTNWDLVRLPRGGTEVNLTADTSDVAAGWPFVR